MVSSNHLKPGEKGKVVAKIDVSDMFGRISKRVKVISNDPKRPVVMLIIYAVVR
jgi:hypothetical protein